MKNLADIIESFIVRELLADEADQILVQRNELAVRLSCAPSQISYVLSTRFTPERGYIVESRRGSGGFVRIARQTVAQEIERDGEEALPMNIRVLAASNKLALGEAVLLSYMMEVLEGRADANEKTIIFAEALAKLRMAKRGRKE